MMMREVYLWTKKRRRNLKILFKKINNNKCSFEAFSKFCFLSLSTLNKKKKLKSTNAYGFSFCWCCCCCWGFKLLVLILLLKKVDNSETNCLWFIGKSFENRATYTVKDWERESNFLMYLILYETKWWWRWMDTIWKIKVSNFIFN